jgi:hypothetical protein
VECLLGRWTMAKIRSVALCGVLLSLLLGVPGEVDGHSFALSGTIRDFHQSHPDFERAICGLTLGMVDNGLGSDGKPMYGPNGELCIQSQDSLSQWFNDVAQVNLSDRYTLYFANGQADPGGTYTSGHASFFPVDNALFGNEGNAHNFHFTYEVHGTFIYHGGEFLSADSARPRRHPPDNLGHGRPRQLRSRRRAGVHLRPVLRGEAHELLRPHYLDLHRARSLRRWLRIGKHREMVGDAAVIGGRRAVV